MVMKLRLALFATLIVSALALAVVVASGAFAHGPVPAKATVARHADGPWTPGVIHDHMAPGDTLSFYVRVKNTSSPGHTENVSLFDEGYPFGSEDGYRVKWFKGRRDISNSTQGGTYDFKLKHNRRKTFRVRVHAVDTSSDACVLGDFQIKPENYFTDAGEHINASGGPCVF
jgi:hypothetical protein